MAKSQLWHTKLLCNMINRVLTAAHHLGVDWGRVVRRFNSSAQKKDGKIK